MKASAVLLAIALGPQAHASLPTASQNLSDLEVMYEYVTRHEVVLESLTSIDLANHAVHFGAGRKVSFHRGPPPRGELPVPGPATELRFKDASCAVGNAMRERVGSQADRIRQLELEIRELRKE